MNKKYASYSALLLLSLVVVSVLLNQDIVHGVVKNTDVALAASPSSIASGSTVTLTGTLNFANAEEVFIHKAALVVAGPGSQDLDIALPAQAVTAASLVSSTGASGTLLNATMAATGLILPGGTLPGDTLPKTTLPAGTLLPSSPLPAVTCPGANLPSGTLPGDTLPATLPTQALPGGTLGLGGTLPGGIVAGTTLNGSGQFKATASGAAITHTVAWQPTTVGSYQAQLVITLVSSAGCSVSRSPIASFSVTAGPTSTATATPTSTTTPTPTPSPTPVPGSPTSTPTVTPTITPIPDTPTITPTPFPTPKAEEIPVTLEGQTATYVTSQAPAVVTDPGTGIKISIPAGAIPGDGRAFAIVRAATLDTSEGVAAFIAALDTDVANAYSTATENLPGGTVFVAGNKVIQIDFVGVDGKPIKLAKKVSLKFPFKASDFADATAAGGAMTVLSLDVSDKELSSWKTNPSTIDFGTFSVRSKVECCSFFTLAIVSEAATPTPVEPTATAIGPPVGDVAPSSRLLVVLLMVGVALVGGGAFYIRRRSES